MTSREFVLTEEQLAILRHQGAAFVHACPGAGKTRVIVEMARSALARTPLHRASAFLSFTKGAIATLENQMRLQHLIGTTAFPHFVGTFDSFLWRFFVCPSAVKNRTGHVRLIPDKSELGVRPFPKAQVLPLSCFDRNTGAIIPDEAARNGFRVTEKAPNLLKAYVTVAARMLGRLRDEGCLDFTDAREVAIEAMEDPDLGPRLRTAIGGRFSDIVVDEAQDCNPQDLAVLSWLRAGGIAVKVVCDPFQSIYEFRGGVTTELFSFAESYRQSDVLTLTGNFRSSDPICRAISTLRPLGYRDDFDEPLGRYRANSDPVHLVAYPGRSVPASIGVAFGRILEANGISFTDAPIVAATAATARKAIGQPSATAKRDLALRLAESVTDYHFAFHWHQQIAALEHAHEVLLTLSGETQNRTYHQHVDELDLSVTDWRPEVMEVVLGLRYDEARYPDARTWLDAARDLLKARIPPGKRSIGQLLRWNSQLPTLLSPAPSKSPPARTIHSVKGLEFPAIGVVTVPQTLKSILGFLETGEPDYCAEPARELYVAASRAQRLLAFFAPAAQVDRLSDHLGIFDAPLSVTNITDHL